MFEQNDWSNDIDDLESGYFESGEMIEVGDGSYEWQGEFTDYSRSGDKLVFDPWSEIDDEIDEQKQ